MTTTLDHSSTRGLLNWWKPWMGFPLAAVVLLALPFILDNGWTSFATVAAISIITVVGLQILMGTCGQVSLGQSAFMGIGAYTSGVLTAQLGLPPLLTLVAGGIAAALIGAVFALPAARIHGFYLALTTMALMYIFIFTVPRLPEEVFGGANGIVTPRPEIFGVLLRTADDYYWFVIPIAAVLVVGAMWINRSQLGRQMIAVREDELAAAVTGIRPTRTKIIAFSVASFYAGVAGALLGFVNGIAHYEQFNLFESIWFIGFLVVGGVSSTRGAVLGTLVLTFVQEMLYRLTPAFSSIPVLGDFLGPGTVFPLINVVFGVVIIVTLLFKPKGLIDFFDLDRWFGRRRRKTGPQPEAA